MGLNFFSVTLPEEKKLVKEDETKNVVIFFERLTQKIYLSTKRKSNKPAFQKTKLKSGILATKRKQYCFSKAVKYDIQRIFP